MTMVHNLGTVEVTDKDIKSALFQAAMMSRTQMRHDSDGNTAHEEGMIDRFRRDAWGRAADAELRRRFGARYRLDAETEDQMVVRNDDATPVGSAGFQRDFDFVHRRMLTERRPELTANLFFPANRGLTPPLGYPTHTVRRAQVAGKARWHQRGTAFPITKAGYVEEQFKTGFAVMAVEQSYFEALTIGAAGLQTYEIEAGGCLRALDEFVNDVCWYGAPERGIYGVLTYPDMPKTVIPLRYISATDGAQLVAMLHAIVNTPMIRSGSIVRPNRMAVSTELAAFLATTMVNGNAGTTTLAQFFLQGQNDTTGIKKIEIAHELSASMMTANKVGNPLNYHGILVWKDDPLSLNHVLPQAPTFLPIWRSSPIDTLHVAFASTGGVAMHNMDALLAFVRMAA